LDIYATEQEQLEALKRWFKKYGTYVIVAAMLGFAIGFGWHYWQGRQLQVAGQASITYEQMLDSYNNRQFNDFWYLANELTNNYPKTTYADLAGMLLAKQAVNEGKIGIAIQKLQAIIDNSKESNLRQIARIRLARIQISDGSYNDALRTLDTIDNKEYMPLIQAVKGDAWVASGKVLEAKQSYEEAIRLLATSNSSMQNLLRMKLSQLAD
jgi:predicted negative regulator of RcsB-dependent stress response